MRLSALFFGRRINLVEKRKLAIPYTTVFICELSKGTQDIIREDMEQHSAEHGYRLEWDRETLDYVGMTRRFCDIEDMYKDTKLEFCKEGEDVEEYEKNNQRQIILNLKDTDMMKLCKKAGSVGLPVSELLENFVADLTGSSRTNGSDERMYANQWFERCWFSFDIYYSFLSYLVEWGGVDSAVEIWEALEDYKEQDDLDEYDLEEQQALQEELNNMYEEYRENREDNTRTLEVEMKEVLKWKEERDRLMNKIQPEKRNEKGL